MNGTGMVSKGFCLLVLFWGFSSIDASVCPKGKQFLHMALQKCINCTECGNDQVVLRPCDVHRDAVCGSVTEFFKTRRHRHNKHYVKHRGRNATHPVEAQPTEQVTLEPFSIGETLIWDWQAIALCSAVFVCILFFLVIAFYSMYQTRQWRRLKENFEAGFEEQLLARINLLATSPSEKELFAQSFNMMTTPEGAESESPNKFISLEHLSNARKEQETNKTENEYVEETRWR